MPIINLEKALEDLCAEVELGFDEKLALSEAARCLSCDVQTVFFEEKCIECVACEDICPMDCINFIENGSEPDLRSHLKVSAVESDRDIYVSGALKSRRIMVRMKMSVSIAVFAPSDVRPGHGICKNFSLMQIRLHNDETD